MAMAFDIRGKVETNEHTAPVDRSELTPADIEDLRWFWNDHEAECGVRSSFGAQRERAAAIRAAAEECERAEAKLERAMRAGARARRELVRQTHGAGARGGIEFALDLEDERALLGTALSFERVRGHEIHPLQMPDLYDPEVMFAVKRARRIRATLLRMHPNDVLVLFACYGPHRDDYTMRTREKPGQERIDVEERELIRESLTRTIRQRFSVELADLVVASVRAAGEVQNEQAARQGPTHRMVLQNHEGAEKQYRRTRGSRERWIPIPGAEPRIPYFGDHEARRAVISRSKRAEFVRMQKVRAEKLIEAAGAAYALAKHPEKPKPEKPKDGEPKKPKAKRWYNEPVYGPGEPGERPLLGFRWVSS